MWYCAKATLIVYLQALLIGMAVETPLWIFLKILIRYGYIPQDAEDLIAPKLAVKAVCGMALLITVAILISYLKQTRSRFDSFLFRRKHTRNLQVSRALSKEELTDKLIEIGCTESSIKIADSTTKKMIISAASPQQRRSSLLVREAHSGLQSTRWFRSRNFLITINTSDSISEIQVDCWPTLWFEYLDMTETTHLMLEEFISMLKYPSK
jgi:hypothetical protein